MIFRPELAELVMGGEKTQTRRRTSSNPRSPWYRERCGFRESRDYAVQPGRGKPAIGRIVIEQVTMQALDGITDYEAEAEGFQSRVAFLDYWRELHGANVDVDELVWCLRFRVAGGL